MPIQSVSAERDNRTALIACAERRLQCFRRFAAGGPNAKLGWVLELVGDRHAALAGKGRGVAEHRRRALLSYQAAYAELSRLYMRSDDEKDFKRESHVTVFTKILKLLACQEIGSEW